MSGVSDAAWRSGSLQLPEGIHVKDEGAKNRKGLIDKIITCMCCTKAIISGSVSIKRNQIEKHNVELCKLLGEYDYGIGDKDVRIVDAGEENRSAAQAKK